MRAYAQKCARVICLYVRESLLVKSVSKMSKWLWRKFCFTRALAPRRHRIEERRRANESKPFAFLCKKKNYSVEPARSKFLDKQVVLVFVFLRSSYGEVCRADRGNRHLLDWSWAAKPFGRQTELSSSDETSASSRHFFLAQKKSSKQVFSLLFFFLSSFFPSSFWRRVPRLAPSYWTILVKQILNQ